MPQDHPLIWPPRRVQSERVPAPMLDHILRQLLQAPECVSRDPDRGLQSIADICADLTANQSTQRRAS